MLKTKKRQSGFTLVEIIVTIGVFSLLVVVVTALVVSVLQANIKVRANSITLDNVNIILESLVRDIRSGSSYHCGDELSGVLYSEPRDCISDEDRKTFAYERSGGNPNDSDDQVVLYVRETFGGRYDIYRSTSGGTQESALFELSDVTFENVEFYVSGSEDSQEVGRLMLLVSGEVFPGTHNALPFSYQTTISERFSPPIDKEYQQRPGNVTVSDIEEPTVSFTSPLNAEEIPGGTNVDLTAQAYDDTEVNQIDFYYRDQIDDSEKHIGTAYGSGPTYSYRGWNTVGGDLSDGDVTLIARAADVVGKTTDATVTVTLKNPEDVRPPSIFVIEYPAADGLYNDAIPWNMRVVVDDDNVGNLNFIRFLVDGVLFQPAMVEQSGDLGTYEAVVNDPQHIETCTISDWLDPGDANNPHDKWACKRTFTVELEDSATNPADDTQDFYIQDGTPPEFGEMTFSEDVNDIEVGDKVDISIRVSDPYGGTGVDHDLGGNNAKNVFRYKRCSLDGSDCGNEAEVSRVFTKEIPGGYKLKNFVFEYQDGGRWEGWSWEPVYRPVYTFWAVDEDRAGNSSKSQEWEVTVQQDD